MIITTIAALSLLLALVPFILFLRNLQLYVAPGKPSKSLAPVSILIPARNEEQSIGAAIVACLQSEAIDFEVVVVDDHSEDQTAAIVREIQERDSRVRLESAPPLPNGWCGKQFACWTLSRLARYSVLLFVDADVRVAPDGVARMASCLEGTGVELMSGIPRQKTVTFLEWLILPLIHFLLLGYLPIWRMRRSSHPAYGAGCGQMLMVRRDAYLHAHGHAAIRGSLHDGVALPRAFRAAGMRTDICDATELADCRMYRSSAEVWNGLAKNATEGLAHSSLIVPSTVILLGGQVAPVVLLAFAGSLPNQATILAGIALLLGYSMRIIGCIRFRQSWLGMCLHPLGVGLLVAIQWYAQLRVLRGKSSIWKGRSYGADVAIPFENRQSFTHLNR